MVVGGAVVDDVVVNDVVNDAVNDVVVAVDDAITVTAINITQQLLQNTAVQQQ